MTKEFLATQLRQEYESLTRLSSQIFEQASAAEAKADHINTFRKTFDHFRAHLTRQMALEEADGFMNHVLERRPTLSRMVDSLQNDHKRILSMTEEIRNDLTNVSEDNSVSWAECRLRIKHLLSQVKHHGYSENMLVSHVFGVDIGAGD